MRARRRGFTLLELVVVVVVLGVLTAIAVPTFARVQSRSGAASGEATVAAVLREGAALAASDSAPLALSHLQDALADTPGYSAVLGDVAPTRPRSASMAAVAGVGGVAVLSPDGSGCVMGRARDARVETWTPARPLDTCTGLVALQGPSGSVDGAPAPGALAAPTDVSVVPGALSLTLSWSPVDGASGYRLRTVSQQLDVDTTSATISGLTAGSPTTVHVMGLGADGSEGTATTVSGTPRPAGPWDAQLAWRYDGNTVCFGGASSWSYRALVTVPVGEDVSDRYRLQVRPANEASPGVSVWTGPLLAHHSSGVLSSPTEQLCAPEGNPDPPFLAVKLVVEATGEDVTLGRTGEVLFTSDQVERAQGEGELVPTSPES